MRRKPDYREPAETVRENRHAVGRIGLSMCYTAAGPRSCT